jgi:SAM-dependent methyltransferase
MTDAPREQRFVFGEVAETYDRARPGYPPELVDDVVSAASLGERDRVLEVGCGTGKATVQFAARGLGMLCLEPSTGMATVGRRNCACFPDVTIETTSFEQWPVERGAFPSLVSSQAWHWVSPEVRLPKAHDALTPGGVLAIFWNTVDWRDEEKRAAFDELYERLAPDLLARKPALPGTVAIRNSGVQELEGSTLFRPATTRDYRWSQTYTTEAYVELLSTQSDHRMLSPDVFQRLAHGVAELINGAGGTLCVDYVTRLHLALRADFA